MSTNQKPSVSARQEPKWQGVLGMVLAATIIIGGPTFAVVKEWNKPRELTASELRVKYEASLSALNLYQVAVGKRLYEASCIACHGQTARGVPNLGRDLVEGDYSRKISDKGLQELIIRGRSPGDVGFRGPVPMPPRGGRPDFGDEDVSSIVAYVRALQVPSRIGGKAIPEVRVELLDGPEEVAKAPKTPTTPTLTEGMGATVVESTSGVNLELNAEALKRGKRVYMSCITCHAKDGAGVKGMGADLKQSSFVRSKSDGELRDFIKTGRQPGAPGSVLNLAMPPKGGNPALKDSQLDDVVVYLRWLQQQANAK